jgi:hypothetical protein
MPVEPRLSASNIEGAVHGFARRHRMRQLWRADPMIRRPFKQ